jgi:hypothetical protein
LFLSKDDGLVKITMMVINWIPPAYAGYKAKSMQE